ncbi:MAG: sensor histidine kinase [Bacteroidota bacterium]
MESEASAARADQARLAHELRHLGRLYPVLAHDLHAFLNTMVLNLELLQRAASRPDLDAEAASRIRKYAALVAEEIPPLDRMLKAVVGQMRLADPPTKRFDFRTLCEELAIVFGSYSRHRRVAVRTTLADVPMNVDGDRDAVAHALTSLLLAAIDALPEGTPLAFTLQAGRHEAVLTVAAESAAPIPWLLEPASEPVTIAREILERHAARLNFSSETVRLEIELPLAPLAA